MELTFVVAVNTIWQLQPSWLNPCKVCDQRRSVGKIKFTRNRKTVGGWRSSDDREKHILKFYFYFYFLLL